MIIQKEIEDLCKECLYYWGFDQQLNVAQEECAELIVALSHLKRDRSGAIEEVIEECADVYLMLTQIMEHVGRGTVMNVVEFKANKIKNKLNLSKEIDGEINGN